MIGITDVDAPALRDNRVRILLSIAKRAWRKVIFNHNDAIAATAQPRARSGEDTGAVDIRGSTEAVRLVRAVPSVFSTIITQIIDRREITAHEPTAWISMSFG